MTTIEIQLEEKIEILKGLEKAYENLIEFNPNSALENILYLGAINPNA